MAKCPQLPEQVTSWLPMLSVPGTQILCLDLEPPEPPQDTLQEDHSLQHPQVGVVDEVACKHWSKKKHFTN